MVEGRKWLNSGGVANAIFGGWQASTVFRYSSASAVLLPRHRRSLQRARASSAPACIPAIVNPDRVFAQDKGDFDPNAGPLFNKDAFEPLNAFNFYYGRGNRIEEDVRGFAYRNQDLSFIKNTALPGGTNLQFSAAIFNVWNWHILHCLGRRGVARPSTPTSPARTSASGTGR